MPLPTEPIGSIPRPAALIESLSEQDQLEVIEFSMRANRYTTSPVSA